MKKKPMWYFNEMLPPGRDYFNDQEVSNYDKRHNQFRDIEADNETILDLLDVRADQTVIDIGTGTGTFAMQAAKRGANVIAVDISKAMLDFAKQKAKQQGVADKIEFHVGGFLSYEHQGPPASVISSQMVLHHLPDFWKLSALQRVANMLEPKGKFFLKDVVYSFDTNKTASYFDGIIEKGRRDIDNNFAMDFENHIRDEYSTFDWVMEGLLTRAGFDIMHTEFKQGFQANYLCQKNY